ncbi:MAG: type II secretion system protein GspF [Deltaproteobacteria bacterium RIFCSPHIGHO2_12_FULL_43_9]|nr:MAG: type II secretion system protein GspF [Deltaproteobacteria bacterium RIFCSPHIGHO2_12_FULL_43_9]
MPLYGYRGIERASGKTVKGEVDAENSRMARIRLKKQGIYITEMEERTPETKQTRSTVGKIFKRIKIQDLSILTTQLATLEKANIPLVEGLNALCNQLENEKLRLIISDVRDRVNEGSSLGDALAVYPKVFSNLYINMVRAGETSGTLPLVFKRLSEFLDYQVKLRSKIIGALTYPIIMMVVGSGLIGFLFIAIVPKLVGVFADIGQELPLVTKFVIGVSNFLQGYWYLILIFIGLTIFLIRRWKRTEKGRFKWDTLMLKLPLAGRMTRMINISRFTRTLSTLLGGGVPLLVSMDIVKNVVQNRVIFKAIAEARESITEGQSIAKPLITSNQFPPMVTHMIAIGEKTGELEHMLVVVADAYDVQVETRISQMTSLLEPLMIIIMGGVVALIVVAMILPILQLQLT